tara:strand:- start:1808 stop:2527 length:720 start_codon:yes stop_codon:yes gene_type:complete
MFVVLILSAALMFAIEYFKPARRWPMRRSWWFRAMMLNGFQILSAYGAASLLDQHFADAQPLDNPLPGWAAMISGYLVLTFIYYWWHRARHDIPFLWRTFHQVHHSPARLELLTTFYKHPLEIMFNSLLSAAILFWLVGLNIAEATVVVGITGLAELYYHWNIKTPRWTGLFLQRPEMHCVHHETGVHHHNYADLPLWDMLFGTYRNPHNESFECGLGDTVESNLVDLLLTKDLSGAKR